MFGVFFGIGLGLGLLNALLVQRSVEAITAEDHPLKKKMALNSATRLLVITAIGLTIAFLFRPQGFGVVFGLAIFQVLLVMCTALPVMKKIQAGRTEDARTDRRAEADTAMTETILAAEWPPSRSATTHEVHWFGMTVNADTCWPPRSPR